LARVNSKNDDEISTEPMNSTCVNEKQSISSKIAIIVRPHHLWKKSIKPLKFLIMTTDTFKKMMEVYCARQHILLDDLIITYKGAPVFPFSTPEILGIHDGDELGNLIMLCL
jgi:hypothetical protein